jgi:hypothetical protein
MCEERILENVLGNLGFGDHWRGVHRKVTVASSGRRHCGCAV